MIPGAATEIADPLIHPESPSEEIDRLLLDPLWTAAPDLRPWFVTIGALAGLWVLAIAYTVLTGIGTWGHGIPVLWAIGIVNMVWWIGVGHAGIFVTAFLLLLEPQWRSALNRLAQAMTLLALLNAVTFPMLHLGRPWLLSWLVPNYAPTEIGSRQLTWDLCAIAGYLGVSLLFWYTGSIPELAAARDRAPEGWRRRLFGIVALGWRGAARDWAHWRVAYELIASVATPLVLSVHAILALDFAIGVAPGWRSTIFPPYFVIGALHSGFATLLVLLAPIRSLRKREGVVDARHFDALSRLLLGTAYLLGLCYALEAFVGWSRVVVVEHSRGTTALGFWTMVGCNCVVPQLLWDTRVRRSPRALIAVGLAVLLGMWLERYVVVVGSLSHDGRPSSWAGLGATLVDGCLLIGSIGGFLLLIAAFVRFVPPELMKLVHGRESA